MTGKSGGFTWVEVVLVLALLALLSTLAWPSFHAHWQGVRRMQAQAQLVAWHLERARQGDGAAVQSGGQPFSEGRHAPPPLPLPTSHYRWRLEWREAGDGLSHARWVLWAEPLGPQQSDRCGVLGLDEAGLRYALGLPLWQGVASSEASRCWP